ncbi:hypothetical protein ACIBF6_02410 [Streptosporangium amethystogenes]|uniref:hypothetical protein n=1 Tax=Streptosporangium amethystogenes TaxID=2002 RepID=UPI0037B30446
MTRHAAWKPFGTVRMRLTLLYTGLFLVTSTILLTVVNLLLTNALESRLTAVAENLPPFGDFPPSAPGMPAPPKLPRAADTVNALSGGVLRYQWTASAFSSPTPPTNCGPRSPSSGPRSRSGWTTRCRSI